MGESTCVQVGQFALLQAGVMDMGQTEVNFLKYLEYYLLIKLFVFVCVCVCVFFFKHIPWLCLLKIQISFQLQYIKTTQLKLTNAKAF